MLRKLISPLKELVKSLMTGVLLMMTIVVSGQVPVILEAESGTLGEGWSEQTNGGVNYVTITTNGTAGNPETDARVISFEVAFESAGTYDLYARVRVGAGGADDDSFFYGNGFGAKSAVANADWVQANNLGGVGYTTASQVVDGGGPAGSEVWKWLNLTQFQGDAPGITFEVTEDALTRTFLIGAREDGLDLDKLAFGLSGYYYTVSNLDNGEAGSDTPPDAGSDILPMAHGQEKWVGSTYSSSQSFEFEQYWNQVTPENAGKWGSVEGTRDVYNWGALDEAYDFAKANEFPFRFHVLIWGNQQPGWIESLSPEEQLEEITEWMDTVAARYPDIDYLEVVNEPINDPPSGTSNGNYIDALGGTGQTGWDWIVTAFRMARERFPNAKLMINEYGIVSSTSRAANYKRIIELLQSEDLIDGIGVQAHAFSTTVSSETMQTILDNLAETGLPIQATELDIDGPTDEKQLSDYQRIFPVFWKHPSVEGITLWGYRPGMWRTEQQAYLLDNDNNPRPAMIWLRDFVESNEETVLGLEETAFQLYPNPVINHVVTVNAPEMLSRVVIFNFGGHLVAEFKGLEENSISIPVQLSAGVYLLKAEGRKRTYTRKIMVR